MSFKEIYTELSVAKIDKKQVEGKTLGRYKIHTVREPLSVGHIDSLPKNVDDFKKYVIHKDNIDKHIMLVCKYKTAKVYFVSLRPMNAKEIEEENFVSIFKDIVMIFINKENQFGGINNFEIAFRQAFGSYSAVTGSGTDIMKAVVDAIKHAIKSKFLNNNSIYSFTGETHWKKKRGKEVKSKVRDKLYTRQVGKLFGSTRANNRVFPFNNRYFFKINNEFTDKEKKAFISEYAIGTTIRKIEPEMFQEIMKKLDKIQMPMPHDFMDVYHDVKDGRSE